MTKRKIFVITKKVFAMTIKDYRDALFRLQDKKVFVITKKIFAMTMED